MFNSPKELATRLLTRMPDRFRNPTRTEWADTNRGGHPVDAALEGPCLDAQGRLYVVDIPYGRIFCIEGTEWRLITQYDGWPNGLKMMVDGTLLAADYRLGLVQINPATGEWSPKLRNVSTEGFKGLNDLTLHPDGSVFFTDQGQTGLHDPSGRVWRLRPDDRIDLLINNGPSPNGLVLNHSKSHLYVAMSRSSEIWRFAIRNDALVQKAQRFTQIPGGTNGPDGLAMDSHDRLFICDPAHGCVWVVDAFAEPLYRIMSCAGRTLTNCVLSADERTLFITDSATSSIQVCGVPEAGPSRWLS
jgi:gluconolactonase